MVAAYFKQDNQLKMQIGILTLPFNNNYGGYLQAYALMTVVKQLGHEPNMIMRRHDKPKVSCSFKIKYALKGIVKTFLRFKKYPIIYNVETDYLQKGRNMLRFVNQYIKPQSPYLYSKEELCKYCLGKFDAYIVGSDQIWRAIYVPDIKNYFLDFTEGWDVKRIAYAASFGTDKPEYTEEQILQCKQLIDHFDVVSLREKSGLSVLSEFGWNANVGGVVLDPTLLLAANDYLKVLPTISSEAKDKIFYYVLDRNNQINAVLNQVSQTLHKKLYGISDIQRGKEPLASIEEWLMDIRDSEFVVTDSFHGMVFSVIFHKPFMVLVNKGRGSDRFDSLLSLLGLSDRMLMGEENINKIVGSSIVWSIVDEKISYLKQRSMSFLKQNLI